VWGLLRIVLLVVNALFFATLVYVVVAPGNIPRQWVDPFLYAWISDPFLYGLMTCLALNFVYLLLGLRQRADRSRQDK
jgi:hypothetical protein